jgi:hypothetical protein
MEQRVNDGALEKMGGPLIGLAEFSILMERR